MYKKTNLYLTKNQARNIAKAMKNKVPVNVNLSSSNLKKTSNLSDLYLTKSQLNRISKAGRQNKNLVLNLSKAQLDHMRKEANKGNLKGGFLSAALPILAASVGSNFISDALGIGGGLYLPGTKGSGTRLPGSGTRLPGTGHGREPTAGVFKGSGGKKDNGIPFKDFLDELDLTYSNGKIYEKKQ